MTWDLEKPKFSLIYHELCAGDLNQISFHGEQWGRSG